MTIKEKHRLKHQSKYQAKKNKPLIKKGFFKYSHPRSFILLKILTPSGFISLTAR